jgi:hypothetical protein
MREGNTRQVGVGYHNDACAEVDLNLRWRHLAKHFSFHDCEKRFVREGDMFGFTGVIVPGDRGNPFYEHVMLGGALMQEKLHK